MGDTLAGKTRAIWQFVKNFPNQNAVLIIARAELFEHENLSLPETQEPIFVFFDEIARFLRKMTKRKTKKFAKK